MKHLLTCHCKKIKIEVNFEGEISNLVKCNCSICKRKGAVMGIVGQDSLKIIEGEKYITNYKFHSKVANHFFAQFAVFILTTIPDEIQHYLVLISVVLMNLIIKNLKILKN